MDNDSHGKISWLISGIMQSGSNTQKKLEPYIDKPHPPYSSEQATRPGSSLCGSRTDVITGATRLVPLLVPRVVPRLVPVLVLLNLLFSHSFPSYLYLIYTMDRSCLTGVIIQHKYLPEIRAR